MSLKVGGEESGMCSMARVAGEAIWVIVAEPMMVRYAPAMEKRGVGFGEGGIVHFWAGADWQSARSLASCPTKL